MARYDFRTKPDTEMSFYVFDDLRASQNGKHQFDIFYFDHLEQALKRFQDVPLDATPALGIHLNAQSELDIVHRREGEYVHIADYLNFPDWRTDPAVLAAVSKVNDTLAVEWQMNSKVIGGPILIPFERHFERVPDRVIDDKFLNPKRSFFYGQRPDPNSAIHEAYVDGKGWVSFPEVWKAVDVFGYHNPHCPKIKQFNISYINQNGQTGQMDVSPMELQILRERYLLQHGDPYKIKTILDKLAGEIAETIYDIHADSYPEQLETLKKDLLNGEITKVNESLQQIRDCAATDHKIAVAFRLLSRLKSVSFRKRSLDEQVTDASNKTEKKGHGDETLRGPER